MKLVEYLKKQSEAKMSEKDKLLVYENIRWRIENESIFTRFSFYAKVAVYSLFLLFIFFWFFYSPSYKVAEGVKVSSNSNSVIADYVGKIITSTGDFKIYQSGKEIKTNIIRDGDILEISKKSNLTIQVNSWINLYVVWPAKIKLWKYENYDWKDVYVLNMLDGDYLTVKSNIAKDKIVIKSKYLNIESDDKEIDLKYVKKWNATIIENNWWDVIIKNNKKIFTLWKKEKLIFSDSDRQLIQNIFNDNYKKYQLTSSGLKIVPTSNQINRLSHILDRKLVIIAVWKYVLWKLNNDINWYESWKKQLINIIINTYNVLGIKIPSLIKVKLNSNQIDIADLESLLDSLLMQISSKYVIPNQFIERLKVILAYLVLVEKVKIPKWKTIPNLSYLLDYIKLAPEYKKKMLTF